MWQSEANGEGLERAENGINLARLLDRHLADVRAPGCGGDDQSFLLQAMQCIPNRSATHAERIGQRLVAQRLTRRERSVEDPVANAVVRGVVQADARQWRGRGGEWHVWCPLVEMDTVYSIRLSSRHDKVSSEDGQDACRYNTPRW